MAFALSGSTITQSGTDTDTPNVNGNGFTVTTEGLYSRVDFGANALVINGDLSTDGTSKTLSGTGTITIASNAFLRIRGQKSGAANAPMSVVAFQQFSTALRLNGSSAAPATLELYDATAIFSWVEDESNFGRVRTFGDRCWLLNALGTGTSQCRLRITQANTIDFQAKKTYVGIWLNFGRPQTSLKGFTPVNTDGPEINMVMGPPVAQLIDIEDYDTTYVNAAYYVGTRLVLYGGAQVRLINNLVGTNMAVAYMAPVNLNVLTYAKRITATVQTAAGAKIAGATVYLKPIGTPPTGIRAKGQTTDIVWSTALIEAATNSAGNASILFEFAERHAGTSTPDSSISTWFCTGQTRGAESHVVWSSRYGYDKQFTTVILAGNGAATPVFSHAKLKTASNEPADVVTTGISLNFAAKTINVTAPATPQRIYDNIQLALNQSANRFVIDFSAFDGETLDLADWSVVGLQHVTGKIKGDGTASGAMANLSIVGNVTQATPTNLTNVSITGTLAYNTASAATISLTNSQIGTMRNDGAGIVTITRDATSSITNYTDPEINFLNSSAVVQLPTGFDIFSIYASSADALSETNPLFSGTAANNIIRYKAEQYGGQTIFIRPSDNDTTGELLIMPQVVSVGVGDYIFQVVSFSESAQLNTVIAQLTNLTTIAAKEATLATRPTLAQIEASNLAKEATVATRASQTSVNAIPTNPVLTTEPRLNNLSRLDANVSSRLATDQYVVVPPPDLSALATTAQLNAARDNINANVDQIPLTDISALATTAQLATAKSEIIGEIGQLPNLAEIEGSTTLAKETTVASRASQASVSAIPTAPLLANDPRLGNLDATVSSRLAASSYVPPSNLDLSALATTAQLNAARDSINTNIDSIPTVTPPTASENAAAVRTNLSAELARINSAEQVLLAQPYVPTPAPSVIVPNPGVSPDTTKVYAYTESITNRAVAGIEITFELVYRPSKTERILDTGKVSIVTNSQGYAEIELQRGKTYRVTSPRLSLDENFTPTTSLFDLSTLIPS